MKDDTISRQAAIELVEQMKPYHQDADDIAEMIANMPSAQPEIIRCGQCKYAEIADKEDAQDGYTCQFHRGSIWFSGSYCSWAERRTDEQTD